MPVLSSHVLGLFVNAFCALLLLRAATGTANSRFLLHLSMAWALGALDRLVLSVGPLLFQLSYTTLPHTDTGFQPDIDITLTQIDAIVDIAAQIFIFLGSFLLFEYPHQQIPKINAQLVVFLLGFLALLASLANLAQNALILIEVLDSATSTLSVMFLGVALIRVRRLIRDDLVTDIIIFATVFFVFLNAALQPFWYLVKNNYDLFFWYYPALSATSLVSVILIVVFSIRFLPLRERDDVDKPKSGSTSSG